MYPLNLALEDMLQAVRGRCLSEADATNSGIQVAVKFPAIRFNLIVADICEHGNLSVFQEQQQNFITSQAGAAYPGVWQFLVGILKCLQCPALHTCNATAQSQLCSTSLRSLR